MNLNPASRPAKHANLTKAEALGRPALCSGWVRVVGNSISKAFASLASLAGYTAFSEMKPGWPPTYRLRRRLPAPTAVALSLALPGAVGRVGLWPKADSVTLFDQFRYGRRD